MSELRTLKVTIELIADSGYQSKETFESGNISPTDALISAIDELGRIAAISGVGDEAKQAVENALGRVAKWKSENGS